MNTESGRMKTTSPAASAGLAVGEIGRMEHGGGRPAGRILRRKAAVRAIEAVADIHLEALDEATDAELQMAGWAAVLGQAIDWHLAEDKKVFEQVAARPALRLRLVKRMVDALEALDAAGQRAGGGVAGADVSHGAGETKQAGRAGTEGGSETDLDIRVLALAALAALAWPVHGAWGKTLHGRRGPCESDSLDVLLGRAFGQRPGWRGFNDVMAGLAGCPDCGERLARVLENPAVAEAGRMTADAARDAAAWAAMRHDRLVRALLEAAWQHEPGARLVYGLHTALMRRRPEKHRQDVLAMGLALEEAVAPRVGDGALPMEEALTLLDTSVGWMETCAAARPLYEWAFPNPTDLPALAGVQTLVGVVLDSGVAARTMNCAEASLRMRELGDRIARLDIESEDARMDLHRRLAAPLITGAGRIHFDAAPAARSARRRG